jgi:hypothetical protein
MSDRKGLAQVSHQTVLHPILQGRVSPVLRLFSIYRLQHVGPLMGLTNTICAGQIAADLNRRRDEAVSLGLSNGHPLGDLVFSSKDELRTALVFFADVSHEAGPGSREFNIAYLDLFPENGIK